MLTYSFNYSFALSYNQATFCVLLFPFIGYHGVKRMGNKEMMTMRETEFISQNFKN